MFNNLLNNYIEEPLNSFAITAVFSYSLFYSFYKFIKYLYIKNNNKMNQNSNDVKLEYPSVPEMDPLSKEDLEKMKIQHDDNLKIDEIKKASAMEYKCYMLTNNKIKESKLNGDNGVYIDNNIYKGMGRTNRFKIKNAYGDVAKIKKGCGIFFKSTMRYIDFALDETKKIMDSVETMI